MRGRDRRGGDATALVVFKTRVDAWKARESLNDRGVKGRIVNVRVSQSSQCPLGFLGLRKLNP